MKSFQWLQLVAEITHFQANFTGQLGYASLLYKPNMSTKKQMEGILRI